MHRELPHLEATPGERRVRELAATLLLTVGAALDRLARRLARAEAPVAGAEPLLEFHAESGAPEGALYVDGRLVGQLLGVNRL